MLPASRSDKEMCREKKNELRKKVKELKDTQEEVKAIQERLEPVKTKYREVLEQEQGFSNLQSKLTAANTKLECSRKERKALEHQVRYFLAWWALTLQCL